MAQQDPLNLASDGLPARVVGAWVHDKKSYLERYLSVVVKAVGRKWHGKLAYLDLFSGPGRSVVRDNGEEVEGSPLVATRCDFSTYVFVDRPEVLDALRERIATTGKIGRAVFIEGDCNDVVEKVRCSYPADHLAVVFIDPTGLQIRFETVRKLVENRKMDLLMTVQLGMGITMNLKQYAKSNGDALTAFLGNTSWRKDLQLGGSPSQVTRRIMNRYIEQLRKLGFETARQMPVRTHQNNVLLYFVVLASRHPRGPDLWDKITQIEPSGQRGLF